MFKSYEEYPREKADKLHRLVQILKNEDGYIKFSIRLRIGKLFELMSLKPFGTPSETRKNIALADFKIRNRIKEYRRELLAQHFQL